MTWHAALRVRAAVVAALALEFLTSCAPVFDKGSKSQEEFDRDSTECLEENTTRTAARYGPSRHTDWRGYASCMTSKGYRAR